MWRETSFIPWVVQRSSQYDPTVPILEYDPQVSVTYSHSRALLSTIGPQTIYCCFDGNYPLDVRSRSTNYSQLLPVHVRDMVKLPNKHPHVYKEFWKGGKFTGQNTTNTFSSIPLDQAHEQNNELIKGGGRITGIAENPRVLLRWMVAGPELARMVKEFETTIEEDNTNQTCTPHHEQSRACQLRFISHVQSLVSTNEELHNPFEEESTDLISLVSKDIADPAMKAVWILWHTVNMCFPSVHLHYGILFPILLKMQLPFHPLNLPWKHSYFGNFIFSNEKHYIGFYFI